MHTGSWAWNADTGQLYWSRQQSDIFGLDPQNAKPCYQLFFQVIHAEERALVEEAFQAAVSGGHDFDQQYRIVRPDGGIRHIQCLALPVFGESGEVMEYVGTVVDIAERLFAEDSQRRQAELERVSRVMMMRELAASIAHEVLQPLTGVISNGNAGVRWLRRNTPDVPKARQALTRIVRDGRRASDVIARLKALVTRADLRRDSLQINTIVEEVLALLSEDIRRNAVTPRTHLGLDLPPVQADRIQLQQVLINLIINAIEAMEQSPGSPREIVILTEKAGVGHVRVGVRDSGVGLGQATQKQLFDAFYTTKPHGMGIGLSISRSIIEAHGGQLSAAQNECVGATFEFTLPVFGSSGR